MTDYELDPEEVARVSTGYHCGMCEWCGAPFAGVTEYTEYHSKDYHGAFHLPCMVEYLLEEKGVFISKDFLTLKNGVYKRKEVVRANTSRTATVKV